jgi:hypothetical protein
MSTEEKQEFMAEMLETQASNIPTLDDLISLAFNTL